MLKVIRSDHNIAGNAFLWLENILDFSSGLTLYNDGYVVCKLHYQAEWSTFYYDGYAVFKVHLYQAK